MTERESRAILDRIGERLRETVDNVKEQEITGDTIRPSHIFFPSILNKEYEKAQELKQKLLKEYEGIPLEEVINGEELKTERGTCYRIETQDTITLKMVSQERAKEKILSDLKLVYGVGEVTEWNLKAEGYDTIKDLLHHLRYGSEAAKALAVDMGDMYSMVAWVGRWLPKSHPLILYSSSFQNRNDFIILDIETMGLSSLPIILCGVAQISGNQLFLNQYLLRTITEEPGALSAFLSHTTEKSIFVTFNGKTFDIPYLKERLAYYGLKEKLENPHVDLLHFSRRAWKTRVPDCRLTTLEEHLFGIKRENDIPSALVPDFYDTYMKTGNVGPLIPIVEHNKQDIVTLVNIFSRLHQEWE